MLKMSRKTLFAVEAVLDIAYNASDQPVQSREITARQNIPRRYLEQVLQQLVRARILTGVRGPRGGYRLAMERRRITVGSIVRAIHEEDGDEIDAGNGLATEATESREAMGDPELAASGAMAGSDLGQKVVRPMWDEILVDMMGRLDTITVQDLCATATEVGIESETARRLDYSI